MVDVLAGEGKARESIRTSKTALAMVLDHVAVRPNPARDRRVKLRLEEPKEVEPPVADHVEAAAWMLAPSYVLGLLVLDATGARMASWRRARSAAACAQRSGHGRTALHDRECGPAPYGNWPRLSRRGSRRGRLIISGTGGFRSYIAKARRGPRSGRRSVSATSA